MRASRQIAFCKKRQRSLVAVATGISAAETALKADVEFLTSNRVMHGCIGDCSHFVDQSHLQIQFLPTLRALAEWRQKAWLQLWMGSPSGLAIALRRPRQTRWSRKFLLLVGIYIGI